MSAMGVIEISVKMLFLIAEFPLTPASFLTGKFLLIWWKLRLPAIFRNSQLH